MNGHVGPWHEKAIQGGTTLWLMAGLESDQRGGDSRNERRGEWSGSGFDHDVPAWAERNAN